MCYVLYFVTFFYVFFFLIKSLCLNCFYMGCESTLNKGHSRQCPSLKCVKSITCCFCFTCVYRLYGSVPLSSLSTSDKRSWIFTCGRHSICFSDCSKSRYLQKLYKVAFFFFFSLCVFGRCHILNRCRLEKPAPHSPTPLPRRLSSSLSMHSLVRSSNLSVRL